MIINTKQMQLKFFACNRIWPVSALLLLMFFSCRKQEVQVEPIGEPVPYDGPVQSLARVLDSSGLTLFNTAWKRSGMDNRLFASGIPSYTLLAPVNEALEAAGWNLEKINNSTPETLDTLLAYYTLEGTYRPANMNQLSGNTRVNTLLTAYLPDYDKTYQYALYIGLHNGALMVDGKKANNGAQPLEAVNGVIYPIDHLLERPVKNIYDYLLADPRFTLYMEALRISDSLYEQTGYHYPVVNISRLSGVGSHGVTLLAPTNEAFRKSGFTTVEDIRDYILRVPLEYPSEVGGYFVVPTTAMDSLIKVNYIISSLFETAYFTNDMTDNPALSGLLLERGSPGFTPSVYIGLDFINDGGALRIRRRNTTQPPLQLAGQDIRLLNGVVHIINENLFPQ